MGITRYGTAGRDSLVGTTTNDLLHGLDGDDTLNGLEGSDTLYGGNGNDTLRGDMGTLSFYGGAGNDTLLTGGMASMTAYFGRGDGRDTIAGHPDWAVGTNTLQFTGAIAKSDIAVSVSGNALVLSIRGTTDAVTIDSFYNYGPPTPEGANIGGRMTGVQLVKFADGSSWTMDDLKALVFAGTTGNDSVRGTWQADTLAAGAGNDTLYGHGGNDAIDGGAGSNWIDGGSGNDTILGGHDGNDALYGGDGDDSLNGIQGNDTLYGGTGNDTLRGDMGTLSFYGGAGNDTLLTGGMASMTAYFGRGDGQDTIAGHQDWATAVSTLQFTGAIAKSDIAVSVSGTALVLSIRGTTDSVTISSFYNYTSPTAEGTNIGGGMTGVQLVKFADGSSWTMDDLKAIVFAGTTGNDSLRGSFRDDTLSGGSGNDTYVVDASGDTVLELGNDGTDTVRSSLSYTLGNFVENLTLTGTALAGTGNTLANVLTGSDAANVLTGAGGNDTLYGLGGNDSLYGSYSGADVLDGGTGNDLLNGLYGDDLLTGGIGNDTLIGDAGNDVLNGDDGNDSLTGSLGNDTLSGGLGTDLITFNRGDGQDLLALNSGATLYNDVLQFGAGIAPTDIDVSVSGNSVVLSLRGSTDRITIAGFYNPVAGVIGSNIGGAPTAVQQIRFANGTTWTTDNLKAIVFAGTTGDDTLQGSYLDDALNGGAGNDTLYGYNGNDLLDGGTGSNWLDGGAGNDTLTGSYNGADMLLGGDGDDSLNGILGSDTLYGGAGNDTLRGDEGTLSFYGGAGNDTLSNGGMSSMTAYFSRGDGQDRIAGLPDWAHGSNVLQFTGNIVQSDVNVTVSGTSLVLSIRGTSDSVTIGNFYNTSPVIGPVVSTDIMGVQLVKFTDGSSWTAEQLKAIVFSGTSGNDSIRGSASADALSGGAGSDTLIGYEGNDTLNGGSGNDLMVGGTGDDTYYVDSSGDTVTELGGGGTDVVLSSIDYSLGNFVENLTLTGTALNGTGNTLANVLTGNSLGNTLSGGDGDDSLNGVEGNDTLSGGDGNDTLLGDAGDDWLDAGSGIGNNSLDGGAGHDTLLGSAMGDDVLQGGDGNDSLYGLQGSDTLYGGAGNDILRGDMGTLAFYGGTGNDVLMSGSMNSMTAFFARGDGQDTIVGHTDTSMSTTTLQFTGAIAKSDIDLRVSGSALVLSVRGTTDSVAIDRFYNYGPSSPEGANIGGRMAGVQRVQFADGSAWTEDDLKALVFAGTTGHDAINGTWQADTISGGTGNDQLMGMGGNDRLDGGAGDDILSGGSGRDTLIGGTGNDQYLLWSPEGNPTDGVLDVIVEAADGGIDTVVAPDSYTLGANLENLVVNGLAYTAADIASKVFTGTGNALANKLEGSDLRNVLNGLAGNDQLLGHGGNDALYGGDGLDTLSGGTGDDNLWGGTGNDVLYGEAGNDLLSGETGNDTMVGGLGNDTYLVNDSGDMVTEQVGEGTDLVQASLHHILATNIENLTLLTTAALNGTGNLLNNTITGNSAVNVLTGAGGHDTLYGLGGNDILYGSYSGNDALHGGDGHDALNGLYGNDTLYGGTGNDTLDGSWGNDTYQFGRGEGQDRILESDNTTTGVDTLQLFAGVSRDQVWWRKSGSDLEMSIIGTTDKVTVQNWYAGKAYHVEQFRTADGKVLLDTQVDQLVNAMAAFAPPAAGQTTLSTAYQTALNPVIAANWK
jgi:Ca2+-binding RTX toxin-like protein